MDNRLKDLRESIDSVDTKLLELLNERMSLVQKVGQLKAKTDFPLFDPGREEAIYDRLASRNKGPLLDGSLRAVYREILAASRLLQYPLQVAFLGPEWTYSHLAAVALFGHGARYLPFSTLEEVFDALSKGKVQVSIVPIENSLEGGVGRTMDLLYEMQVGVAKECYLEVSHCLASSTDSVESIRKVYAHPQAMGQCRHWILEHLKNVEWHECPSTAQAARQAREDPSGAAICNMFAAQHYELQILHEGIEDHPGNVTRFFALARHSNAPTGNDKTSMLFAVRDQPGALHAALAPFTLWRLNMTRIESRPNRLMPWQYLFYSDVEGHQDDPAIEAALGSLKEQVAFFKILGSYPKSDPTKPIRFDRENVRGDGFLQRETEA